MQGGRTGPLVGGEEEPADTCPRPLAGIAGQVHRIEGAPQPLRWDPSRERQRPPVCVGALETLWPDSRRRAANADPTREALEVPAGEFVRLRDMSIRVVIVRTMMACKVLSSASMSTAILWPVRPPQRDYESEGRELRELRERLGWTREALAAELAISVSSIARWEAGKDPDLRTLKLLRCWAREEATKTKPKSRK